MPISFLKVLGKYDFESPTWKRSFQVGLGFKNHLLDTVSTKWTPSSDFMIL